MEPPTVAFHAAGASRDRFRLATSKLAKIAVDNVGAPCVYTLFEAAGAMNVVAGASEGDGPALTAREPAKTVPAPRNRSSSAKPEREAARGSSSGAKASRRERPAMSPAEIASENKRLSDALTAYTAAYKTGKAVSYTHLRAHETLR